MNNNPDIKVYDNFITPELAVDIHNHILNNISWKFIMLPFSFWESNMGRNFLENGITKFLFDFINENLFDKNLKVFYSSTNPENKYGEGYPNVYFNGQTKGQDGNIHKDSEETNTFTLLYYPIPLHQNIENKQWNYNWGGELNFYNETDMIESILPIPNRLVVFNSNLLHRANAPSKYFTGGLRISLAYKCYI